MMLSRKQIWVGLALILLSMVGLSSAFAQSAPPDIMSYLGATGEGDMSRRLWRGVFGDFADNPFGALGGPTTLLGALFIIFNGAIFVVGSAWMGYGILYSIVGTGNKGEALGERMNTAWYPIRAVTGVTGMMPVLGGYTVSQAMLMWTGTLAIGMANTLFHASIDNLDLGLFKSGAVKAQSSKVDYRELVDVMVKMNLCLKASEWHEAVMAGYGTPVSEVNKVRKWVNTGTDDSGVTTIGAGSQFNPDLCGRVTMKKASGTRGSSSLGFRVASINYDGIAQRVATAHREALVDLSNRIEPAATSWIEVRNNPDAIGNSDRYQAIARQLTDMEKWVRTYQTNGRIEAALAGVRFEPVSREASNAMREHGWLSMSAWSSTYAEANAALADAAGGIEVSISQPRIPYLPSEVKGVMSEYDRYVRDLQTRNGEVTEPSTMDGFWAKMWASVSGAWSGACSTPTGNCSMGQSMVHAINGGVMAGSGGSGLVNPVIGLKNLGDYIMGFSSTVIGYSIIGSSASGVLESIPVVGGGIAKVAEKTASLFITWGMMCFVVGGFLSLYLPMIPFMIWVGGIVSYAASFIEGLIAMPLHSFAHLHTEGEGMGSQTTQGYVFFLNTLLRPSLMVISFIVASALLIGIGSFVTVLYIPAIASAAGNSIVGAMSVMGYVIIYGIIMMVVINGCFELIQIIPDQVIGFVGAGTTQMHLGRDIEQKVNGFFMGSARFGDGAVQGTIKARSAGQGGGGNAGGPKSSPKNPV